MAFRPKLAAVAVALLVGLGFSSQAMPSDTMVSGATPLDPQPSSSDLTPGLSATYYYVMVRDVADISRIVSGSKGAPVEVLDMDTDNGKVLTSKSAQGVGAELRGAINFDTVGDYTLRLLSNDGVKLEIGGELVWEDPTVHPDTWSDPITFTVAQPGWYDLNLDYYQRKGTSALRLVWTKPGGGAEEVVPASAYAHIVD